MQLVTEMRSIDNRIKTTMDIMWIEKSKSKVHFVTHHEGQTGVYSSTVSLTSALDRGWVVNATPRPIYARERNQLPIVKEAGLAPGPVWMGAKNLAFPPKIRSLDLQIWSESLYQLRCPGPHLSRYMTNKEKVRSQPVHWIAVWCRWMHGGSVRRIM
jgi:hypothetical protein